MKMGQGVMSRRLGGRADALATSDDDLAGRKRKGRLPDSGRVQMEGRMWLSTSALSGAPASPTKVGEIKFGAPRTLRHTRRLGPCALPPADDQESRATNDCEADRRWLGNYVDREHGAHRHVVESTTGAIGHNSLAGGDNILPGRHVQRAHGDVLQAEGTCRLVVNLVAGITKIVIVSWVQQAIGSGEGSSVGRGRIVEDAARRRIRARRKLEEARAVGTDHVKRSISARDEIRGDRE